MDTARLFREVRDHLRRHDWRGAGACYYVAQLRLRTLAGLAPHDGELVGLLASAHESLGRPITDWLAGDVRDWVSAIDGALAWDRRNPFPELHEFAQLRGQDIIAAESAYQKTREALEAYRGSLIARRGEMYALRRVAGLPVRDPGFARFQALAA